METPGGAGEMQATLGINSASQICRYSAVDHPASVPAAGVPYSVGPVYVLAVKAKPSADASEQDFWGGSGGKPFATLAFDDCSTDSSSAQGFLSKPWYKDAGPLDRARPCRYADHWPLLATGHCRCFCGGEICWKC